jgi:hypothetical protein
MFGGNGDDTLFGKGSMDTMDGGDGNDAMSGGAKDDVMTGGFGNDAMTGDAGDDVMDGGFGNDTMLGGDGADAIAGDDGDDRLDGGKGTDGVDGGDGDDLIAGGGGNDTLRGGFGSDGFLFRQDEVQGATDIDVIVDWDVGEDEEGEEEEFDEDVIILCGQIDPFFTVEKVELGFFDNFANLIRDVRIGLSNGQFILLLDVGDSGDFVADDVDPENNPEHLDDFYRPRSEEECEIDSLVECA